MFTSIRPHEWKRSLKAFVSRICYRHGLFCSSHPFAIISLVIVIFLFVWLVELSPHRLPRISLAVTLHTPLSLYLTLLQSLYLSHTYNLSIYLSLDIYIYINIYIYIYIYIYYNDYDACTLLEVPDHLESLPTCSLSTHSLYTLHFSKPQQLIIIVSTLVCTHEMLHIHHSTLYSSLPFLLNNHTNYHIDILYTYIFIYHISYM